MAGLVLTLSRRVQAWRGALLVRMALARRARLESVAGLPCAVGVTGSCGKTTVCELASAVLASAGGVYRCPLTYNGLEYTARAVLALRPGPAYAVQELGVQQAGEMAVQTALWRPRIGVVTHIGDDHRSEFGSADRTAQEKGGLVEALPEDGWAVLNADDALVLAMRPRTRARVLTYGVGASADVRGRDIASSWPDRLSLEVSHGDEAVRIQTQLIGRHWAHAVLAAVAVGRAAGLSLRQAADALAGVAPIEGRMSPHVTPGGVTFLRDDWKAPLWTMEAALDVLGQARAVRRVAVIGTVSDYAGHASKKYRAVARQALAAAEVVLFVGPMAHCAAKARDEAGPDRLRLFEQAHALHRFLDEFLRPGDLVLLKGSVRADHLPRLVESRMGMRVVCWRDRCGKPYFCDACRLRRSAHIPPSSRDEARPEA